jgi:hypothetical protein
MAWVAIIFLLVLALLVSLACTVIWYLLSELTSYQARRTAYAAARGQRDAIKTKLPSIAIVAANWPTNEDAIELWTSLAKTLDIHPDLMRPSDRISDIIVDSGNLGTDTYDLAIWLINHEVRAKPYDLLEMLHSRFGGQESVKDMIDLVLAHRSPSTAILESSHGGGPVK